MGRQMYRKREALRAAVCDACRELCTRAPCLCRRSPTLTGVPCSTCSDTSELDQYDRELHDTQTDQRDRVNEVAHDNLLPKVTCGDSESSAMSSRRSSLHSIHVKDKASR